MRRSLLALTLLIAVPIAAQTCSSPDTTGQKDAVPLCAVVNAVNLALQRYQSSLGTGTGALPPLSKAEFDLKTTAATTVGGKISLFVITLGGSHTKTATNEITFTYAPPQKPKGALAPHTQAPFDDQLYATIRGAAEQIRMAEKVGGLPFNSLTITVQFCVKWEANGGGAAPISLITLGLNGDKSRDVTQSVKLTFARP